jgi:FAD/FMN-containing dehydrogenase
MSIEPKPRVLELRAPEALILHHVYGTNGLVLELEVGLAPAHPWLEAVVCFKGFDAAIEFADALAAAPGIVKKSVTLLAAPIPDLLPQLASSLRPGQHAVFVLVAEFCEPGFLQMASEFGGEITHRQSAAEVAQSKRTLVEFTWNHTTLHAMKIDKSLTYIQSGFSSGPHVSQAKALRKLLGEEVLVHLEFIRSKEGAPTCSGLQLVRYTTDARLNEIMQIHRDHGVFISNPHVFHVEDGKQGEINAAVVASKQRFDPAGLLNPGKLRGWDQREALAARAANAANGEVSLRTLPKF